MGNSYNTPSVNNNQQPQIPNTKVANNSNNKINENSLPDEEEIFQKMVDVSNQLFSEYNNEYLNPNFCNKLAIIFEKKLNYLHIKLLRAMNDKINTENVDNEFLMEFQYMPKNSKEDKFFVDIFKGPLKDFFWNQSINISDELFMEKGMDISSLNLKPLQKYDRNPFININHVNNLLTSYNNSNNKTNNNKEKIKENSPEFKMQGGAQEIISGLRQQANKKYNPQQKRSNKPSFGNEETDENNYLKRGRGKANNGGRGSNNNGGRGGNNNGGRSGGKGRGGSSYNGGIGVGSSNNDFSGVGSNNNNGQQIIERRNSFGGRGRKPENNLYNLNTNEESQFRQREELIDSIQENNETGNKNLSAQEISQSVNNAIAKNNQANEKEVNNFIKYSVPRYYKSPTVFCSDEKEECPMTKKEICMAITENFIVRNNIIAAILNTLPKKKIIIKKNGEEKIEYEGGLCYQKFKNLFLCKVCVPRIFERLKHNTNMKETLNYVLENSEFLTDTECEKNGGLFFELELRQKAALINNSKIIKKDKLGNPISNFNLLYLESTEQLKKSYFDNLDALLQILIKMQNIAIINNATLNLIGKETQEIINKMYNYCNYYYVFAIIALIHSDLTDDSPEIEKEKAFQNQLLKALGKKSNSESTNSVSANSASQGASMNSSSQVATSVSANRVPINASSKNASAKNASANKK